MEVFAQILTLVAALAATSAAVAALRLRRLSGLEAAYVVLACAVCVTQAIGPLALFWALKPTPMLAAMIRTLGADRKDPNRFLLLAAQGLSAIGDILYLRSDSFHATLLVFLVVQLAYFLTYLRGAKLLPSKIIAGAVAVYSGAFLVLFWPGVGLELRPSIAVYVCVASLMFAQAAGRAWGSHGTVATMSAIGALMFTNADTLIGLNKFVSPNPLFELAILPLYYVAQGLIGYFGAPRRTA